MPEALRVRQQSRERYVRDLHSVWASRTQVFDPSLWLQRDPNAEEKMLIDADIRGAIDHRRRLVAGKQWTLMPRQESGLKGDLAVAVGTRCLGKLRRFTMSRALLARAFFHGQRFARIHSAPFQMTIGDGRSRTWVLPVKLEDQDKRVYRQVSPDGGVSAFWEKFDIPKSQWVSLGATESVGVINHTHDDEQASLGYGSALREALGWWWYTKAHVFSESTQAAERFGQGMLLVKVDGLKDAATSLSNPDLHQQHLDKWEEMRARHTLIMDKDDEVDVLDMSGQGHELLSGLRKELRDTIFTLVLGANLPTSASEGGSFALAQVQENSTEAIVQFDREALEETLSDDLMGFIWFQNHANLVELGIADEKPRFNITQEKILDPKERAEVAAQASAIGLPLAKEELYEQFGFRKPEEGEEVLEPVAPPQQPFGQRSSPFVGFSKNFFDESKINRDEDGEFAPKEGSGTTKDEDDIDENKPMTTDELCAMTKSIAEALRDEGLIANVSDDEFRIDVSRMLSRGHQRMGHIEIDEDGELEFFLTRAAARIERIAKEAVTP